MAFNLLASRQKKRTNRFVSDPSQLTTTGANKRPSFSLDFQSLPGGRTEIRRQTTAQANLPPIPSFTKGAIPPTSQGARIFQTAVQPAGFDPTGSQFPFELRRGISSDASRQRAFRLGFGSGEGRTGFARRAPGQFFDPRFMFDRSFRNFRLQQRLRRRHGL